MDREQQLPVDEVLRIARQVGDALGYAHERGVIHRDVKPDNILFVSRGSAFYVVDMRTGGVDRIYSTPWDVLGPPRTPDDGRTLFLTRRVTEGDIWLATIE